VTATIAVAITDLIASAKKWMKGAASAALFSHWLEVNPVPASRPRVTRWGTHYSKTYEGFRRAAAKQLEKADGAPTDAPLLVLVECVVEKPRTGKLSAPRGDVDNYAKGPLDALTKAEKFWKDDDQIQMLVVAKRYAKPGEQPGTNVMWTALDDNPASKRKLKHDL